MKPDWLFYALIGLLLSERVAELVIAYKNEKWILSQGGEEHNIFFSKLIVLFHICWFMAFIAEAFVRQSQSLAPGGVIAVVFFALQYGRYWCISSLGKFWNTKVLVLPDAQLTRRGPYKWLKHPNYAIVVIEIFLYPALFGCWWAASIGGVVNIFLLQQRIKQEEQVLEASTNYSKLFPGHQN